MSAGDMPMIGAPGAGPKYQWLWMQIIYPYYRNAQIMYCPSGKADPTVIVPPGGNYASSRHLMAMAETGSPATLPPAIHLSAVPSPSTVYLLMDGGTYNINNSLAVSPAANGNQYLPGNGDAGVTACTQSTTWMKSDCERGRHFGGVTVAFADGHVKWLKTSKVAAEAKKTNVPSTCSTTGECTQFSMGAFNPKNTF
jgi:prepilin-type processing-associated H-X9-DG protein